MNLRIDAESIRVRVSHEEAVQLARIGELVERLPWLQNDVELRVCSVDRELGMGLDNLGRPEIYLPRVRLDTLLSRAQDQKKHKAGLEVRGPIQLGARTIELRFELDQFTVGKV